MGIGEYRIDRALGGGRFEAHHAVVARRVTIKVSADAGPLVREARALERLRHPRVPRVYECEPARSRRHDGHGDDAASSAWIAIERVDGTPVAPRDALAAVRDLAAILDHAHERCVVHGALTADAIAWMNGEAWIVDWSHARLDDRAGSRADDIRALGELACALVRGPLAAPIDALVARMIDLDPDRRPSAIDVRLALERDALGDDDAPPVEDIVLPTDPARDSDVKLRWTPPFGLGAHEEVACRESQRDASSRRNDRRPDRYRSAPPVRRGR